MMQDGVVQVVVRERVAFLPELRGIEFPVFAEFLRAQHQHVLVLFLVVVHDRQRRIGFTEPDAVGENATVVLFQAIDDATDAIPLKLIQGLPYLRIFGMRVTDSAFGFLICFQTFAKNLQQGFEIHEFRGIIFAEPSQFRQHLFLGIFGQVFVPPDVIKPRLQRVASGGFCDRQVEFQIRAAVKTQTAAGEVGTADHRRVRGVMPFDVIHLSVQEIDLLYRADFNLLGFYPPLAIFGQAFLPEDSFRRQAPLGQAEILVLFFPRVHFADGAGVAV